MSRGQGVGLPWTLRSGPKESGHSHRCGCLWRHTPPGARVQGEVRHDPATMAPAPQTPPDPAFVSPEYAENIGDGRSPEFRESEQKRILALLENF